MAESQSSSTDDQLCDPCLTSDQHVEAQRYCLDCGEYLCKTCCDCHLKTKASRNHEIVNKNNIGKQSTTIKDNECPEHEQSVIKFFCPRHDALCCHDCIIMHHRMCDIDYIPKKSVPIVDSEEYKWTMQKLDQKLKELDDITKTAKERDKEIETCHDDLITDIIKFRKEINVRLDHLQHEIQKEAEKKKSTDKKIIQKILDRCNSLSSDFQQLQSSLQANNTKRQHDPLYVNLKRAQNKLKSDDPKEIEEDFGRTRLQYMFERNSFLENMLSKQDALGKLSLSCTLKTQRKKKNLDKLTQTTNINIRTKSDESDCWISGCAVLPSNKLLLADCDNKKLKVVDIPSKSVVEEKSLDSRPFDVTVLPEDQIAVTMPVKNEVIIMTRSSGTLSTVRTIPVEGLCRGITYHQGHIYIVCGFPSSVLILSKQGDVQNKISLNTKTFLNPLYLVLRENFKLIYIGDHNKDCVVSITLEGEIADVQSFKDLKGPVGMLLLDGGSLLVCNVNNGTIHRISGDLKQCETMISGLKEPYSVCYNHRLHEVYIGSFNCDQVDVFRPE